MSPHKRAATPVSGKLLYPPVHHLEDHVHKTIRRVVLLTTLILPVWANAQPSAKFVPDEAQVREALSFKLFDVSSAQISELAAFEAPDGSTSDMFVCGKVNSKSVDGSFGGFQDLAVGVKIAGAQPVYSALGVGEVAAYFCEMVATP